MRDTARVELGKRSCGLCTTNALPCDDTQHKQSLARPEVEQGDDMRAAVV